MKKIMIISAAIVMACASQAATFKWTGANIYSSDLTSKYTGSATIYAYLSTATIADAVKVVDIGVDAGTIKDGATTGYTYNWTGANVGDTYNFYMVIEDGGKTLDTSVTSPTKITSGVAQATSTTGVTFGNMQTISTTASNWAAVPEPTSGLLMLLGMAGLALRRRRA